MLYLVCFRDKRWAELPVWTCFTDTHATPLVTDCCLLLLLFLLPSSSTVSITDHYRRSRGCEKKKEKKKKRWTLVVGGGGHRRGRGGCSCHCLRIDTLAMKVSREGARSASWRRAFQSFIIRGIKENCLIILILIFNLKCTLLHLVVVCPHVLRDYREWLLRTICEAILFVEYFNTSY